MDRCATEIKKKNSKIFQFEDSNSLLMFEIRSLSKPLCRHLVKKKLTSHIYSNIFRLVKLVKLQ